MHPRKVKARYRVVGPKMVKVEVNMASIDPETKSLQQEKKIIEQEMFMVYFPAGHSIRIDRKELVRMGYNLRPRLVDMETGEVVDFGGDPYDFDTEEHDVPTDEIELADDEDTNPENTPVRARKG